MAEREGFEPSIQVLPVYSLSRGAPSASRPSLQNFFPACPELLFRACGSSRSLLLKLLLLFDPFVDFLTMNRNIFRSIHADANLVTLYSQNGYGDIVPDHQSLAYSTSQNEHNYFLH